MANEKYRKKSRTKAQILKDLGGVKGHLKDLEQGNYVEKDNFSHPYWSHNAAPEKMDKKGFVGDPMSNELTKELQQISRGSMGDMQLKAQGSSSAEFMKTLQKTHEVPNPALGTVTKDFSAVGDRERSYSAGNPGDLKTKKKMEDMQKGGMMYEEGGEVKSKVMSMLDGMKDMPAEAEVVKMIVEKHGVSEDQAKAMIAEYKKSKMGMGGKTEYEGGGAMKMMRDPKDMVGMAMGGARIIS